MNTRVLVALLVASIGHSASAQPSEGERAKATNQGAGAQPSAAPPAAAPKKVKTCSKLKVTATDAEWWQVLPERAPPTRSRLSFDSTTGEHVAIEWDPYQSAHLVRRVVLRPGEWQVSFWSEPMRDSLNLQSNLAWTNGEVTNCDLTQSNVFKVQEQDEVVQLNFSKLTSKPKLTDSTATLDSASRTSPTGLQRSLGLDELPAVVAERMIQVVVEVVKTKAMRFVSRRIQRALCPDGNPLPHTCETIASLDLRTIATNGALVGRALVQDLRERALAELFAHVQPATATLDAATTKLVANLEKLRKTVAAVELAVWTPGPRRAERALALLYDVTDVVIGAEIQSNPVGICSIKLALALHAQCRGSGQCSVEFVHDVFSHPSTFFELDTCADYLKPGAAGLQDAMARAQDVFDQARLVTSELQTYSDGERLRATLDVSLEVVAQLACKDEATPCKRLRTMARIVRQVAEGRLYDVANDVVKLAVEYGLKLSDLEQKLATTFLTYAAQGLALARGAADEAKVAEERAERQLQVLLADGADRTARGGDDIFSVGAGVRFGLGVGTGDVMIPMSAPLFLSYDCLWKSGEDKRDPAAAPVRGLHFEAGLLDLGQYFRVGRSQGTALEVEWTDLIAPQIGFGGFWGDGDAAVLVGLDVGYSFTGARADGTNRGGVFGLVHVGAYVPLLDFN